MQREDQFPQSAAPSFVNAICLGASAIYEAYSEFERPTKVFHSEEELNSFIETSRRNGKVCFTLVVHYEATAGSARTRRFALDSVKCGGAKWRETTEGWGLVAVQLTFQQDGTVKGRVSANSQKRAVAWADTMGERLGSPDEWNWPMVEKITRRLIRKLRSAA
jgi:hypothetical protein